MIKQRAARLARYLYRDILIVITRRGEMARWHRRYLAGVLTAACLTMTLVAAGATSATAATTYRTGSSAHAISASRPDAPAGCPSGDVCFYYAGDGVNLCGYTDANSYNLGSGGGGLAPYGNNCANIGEQSLTGGTIFNNGTSCSGCQDVNLYYNTGYTGAFYCLPMGHYLLNIDQNFFPDNETSAGEGAQLGYETDPVPAEGPGGVASAKWTSC